MEFKFFKVEYEFSSIGEAIIFMIDRDIFQCLKGRLDQTDGFVKDFVDFINKKNDADDLEVPMPTFVFQDDESVIVDIANAIVALLYYCEKMYDEENDDTFDYRCLAYECRHCISILNTYNDVLLLVGMLYSEMNIDRNNMDFKSIFREVCLIYKANYDLLKEIRMIKNDVEGTQWLTSKYESGEWEKAIPVASIADNPFVDLEKFIMGLE